MNIAITTGIAESIEMTDNGARLLGETSSPLCNAVSESEARAAVDAAPYLMRSTTFMVLSESPVALGR